MKAILATPSLASGAIIGAILGAVLAAPFLVMSRRGGETWELATLLAAALGMPFSLLAAAFESPALIFWVALLAVPLNGALIGAIVGGAASALGWQSRLAFAAIPLLWAGLFLLTAWRSRTH